MVRYNGEYCRFLSVLSNKDAFAIAVLLLESGPRTQKELSNGLAVPPYRIRTELKNLLRCGYIVRKPTRPLAYGVNEPFLRPLLRLIGSHIQRHRTQQKG